MARRPTPGKTKGKGARAAVPRSRARSASHPEFERQLAEAIEQQAATARILDAISRARGDLGPVMQTLAESAARLCDASDAQIFRIGGDAFRLAASHGPLGPARPVPVTRGSVIGRAVIDGQTIHVRDVAAAVDEFPDSMAWRTGRRSVLAEPLLRDGAAIGVILIRRMEPRPFSERQLALLKAFAAQAVIAIENVRLYTELEVRNRQLTDSLTQQTATAEILRVISSSPADLQPVLDTVVESAARYCGATDAQIWRRDDEGVRLVTITGLSPPRWGGSCRSRARPSPPSACSSNAWSTCPTSRRWPPSFLGPGTTAASSASTRRWPCPPARGRGDRRPPAAPR